jgi:hypothetical protein
MGSICHAQHLQPRTGTRATVGQRLHGGGSSTAYQHAYFPAGELKERNAQYSTLMKMEFEMRELNSEKEKLLLQMAIRQASRGNGATFFHLLFPFCLVISLLICTVAPLALIQILPNTPQWLNTYLTFSVIPTVLIALTMYKRLRQYRLGPIIADLRRKQEQGEILSQGK